MFNLNQSSKAAAYSTNNIFDNLDANPSDEIDASYFFFFFFFFVSVSIQPLSQYK